MKACLLARSRAYGPVLSVCLSVRKHDNSLQTQRIDLKLSTHFFEAKSGAKFEDGQNRAKYFQCHWYLIETNMLGLWGKNKFCPNELKFGTLAFLVIKNHF
jgi:hypothetical protein